MSTCVFEASVVLDAPIDRLYAFHENPNNLLAISPSWLDARVQNAKATAARGDSFNVRVGLRWFPLKLAWDGFWEEVQSPTLLVDGATRSPFRYWQHQHRFESLAPAQTRMTDRVTYQLPGGWLGKAVGETFVRLQFRLMFADRHRRTRRWAKENAVRPPGV